MDRKINKTDVVHIIRIIKNKKLTLTLTLGTRIIKI